MGQSSSRNFIQSHAGQPLDLNPLGNAVTINGYVPLTDNNISSYAVKTLATITGNIDSDYGECFVTFDPIPSGTPPLSSPNIRTINVGNSYSRRTQLAFDYASDTAFFRRRTEAGWFTWREFIHSGNIGSQSVSSAATATNISNNGTVTLATATEANSIYITQPSYTTDQPVKLLNFAWYSEVWQLGNIRSSGATTAGFGVFLNGSEKFRFNRDGVAIFGSSGTFASTITATNGIFNNAAGGSIGLKYGGTDDWVVGENAGAATRDFNIYNFNRTSIELSISRATGTATFNGRISTPVGWTTSGRNYSNEWIEFPNYTGLYSANNNAHFYPNGGSYGAWKIQGTRNGWAGLQFDALDNGAVCLMIYPGSNQTGFYNTTYGWQFLWNNGELQVSKNTYGGGTLYTVLDAANYTSYAPTLTGTGASGTWGIDITGNSATASALTSMDISQFTNDSGYVTSASLAGYAPLDGTGATGLWNISITGTADNAYNIIAYLLGTNSVNVNNTASAVYRNENGAGAVLSYAPVLHVAASDTMWQLQGTYGTTGNGTLYFRQGYNGSWGTWLTMISSANISSYLSGVYLPLTGGTLTGTLNGTRAVFSTAINNDYGLSVTNTGTTGAGGLYVNIGTSATGAPIRVDKAGVNIFLMSSTGNITMAGDLAVNGGDIIISSSGGANVFTRYQNGTGNVEWRLAASVFTLVDNVNEISLMEINPNTSGTFLYYPSLTINTSNTSGGVLLFKATLAANTWGIYKNDTTGLTITKNSVTQLGISATGAITLINTLSVTGGYIEVEQYGLSSSTYSAYIRRNDVSSYGAWDITGGKGGYTGALYNTTNLPHIMFGTTNGFGGLYYQTGSRWVLYYNYTDNCLAVGGTTTNATYKMYVTGAIYATGAIVANSDGRNKENVEVVENALEKVTNLRGVTYTKKDQDSGKREMGVIAQEVEPHVPEVVHYSKDADIYGVSYGNFAGLFIEAIKEQQVLINELKAEIEILKNK